MHGENFANLPDGLNGQGSPPLARGKSDRPKERSEDQGLTPACTGKIAHTLPSLHRLKAHPRLHGENPPAGAAAALPAGSPPLARGKLCQSAGRSEWAGLTPACTGKIRHPPTRAAGRRAHPRLHGENLSSLMSVMPSMGSPPLARGKFDGVRTAWVGIRLTPACTGKIRSMPSKRHSNTAHPRLHGENACVYAIFSYSKWLFLQISNS